MLLLSPNFCGAMEMEGVGGGGGGEGGGGGGVEGGGGGGGRPGVQQVYGSTRGEGWWRRNGKRQKLLFQVAPEKIYFLNKSYHSSHSDILI